ncbi:MAG: dihydrodipicolinate synthase family protein [Anaerolineae bacterium]
MEAQEPLPVGVWPTMITPFLHDGQIDWRGVDALVEWYLERGVAGIFAVCLSSEMYALTPDERLALAAHVVARAAGRVPVVASGTFGGPIAEQASFAVRMAGTGVRAVVILANQLAGEAEPDTVWQARAAELLERTGSMALGLYECPVPYARYLSPDLLAWAAGTGRILFLKDTCSRLALIRAKIAAVAGTPLRFYNADAASLLPSLQAGGHGFSGIAANCYPQLYDWMVAYWHERPAMAERLQWLLGVGEAVVRHKYPTSAKAYLALAGVPIGERCRVPQEPLDEEDRTILAQLHSIVREAGAGLNLPPLESS